MTTNTSGMPVPATKLLDSVTALPAAERLSISILVTPANCAAVTVPPAVSTSTSWKLAETVPVMVSNADSVVGVKLKKLDWPGMPVNLSGRAVSVNVAITHLSQWDSDRHRLLHARRKAPAAP